MELHLIFLLIYNYIFIELLYCIVIHLIFNTLHYIYGQTYFQSISISEGKSSHQQMSRENQKGSYVQITLKEDIAESGLSGHINSIVAAKLHFPLSFFLKKMSL